MEERQTVFLLLANDAPQGRTCDAHIAPAFFLEMASIETPGI